MIADIYFLKAGSCMTLLKTEPVARDDGCREDNSGRYEIYCPHRDVNSPVIQCLPSTSVITDPNDRGLRLIKLVAIVYALLRPSNGRCTKCACIHGLRRGVFRATHTMNNAARTLDATSNSSYEAKVALMNI